MLIATRGPTEEFRAPPELPRALTPVQLAGGFGLRLGIREEEAAPARSRGARRSWATVRCHILQRQRRAVRVSS
jgi:hypothetical protein